MDLISIEMNVKLEKNYLKRIKLKLFKKFIQMILFHFLSLFHCFDY